MILIEILICFFDFSISINSKPLNLNFTSLRIVFWVSTWEDLNVRPWIEYKSHIVLRVDGSSIIYFVPHYFWEITVSGNRFFKHFVEHNSVRRHISNIVFNPLSNQSFIYLCQCCVTEMKIVLIVEIKINACYSDITPEPDWCKKW
jgi:hypothetical protein